MSPQKSDSPGWHITHSQGSMWQEEAECVPCSRCQLINRAAAMWVPEDRLAGPTSGSKEVYSPCRGQRWAGSSGRDTRGPRLAAPGLPGLGDVCCSSLPENQTRF